MTNNEVSTNNRHVGIYLQPTKPVITKGNGKTPDRIDTIFETRYRLGEIDVSKEVFYKHWYGPDFSDR